MSQNQARKLRRQAEMMLRAAAVPTTGGHCTNELLRQLAEKLEKEATEIEARTLNPCDLP